MNRKSRSITRRSSILKIDVNREDDTRVIGARSRRSSRRVSFAEMCQIKEFPRDSPKVYKDVHSDDESDGKDAASSMEGSKNSGITGLDKLLTGAIQTPYQDVAEYPIPEMSSESFNIFDINKTVLDTVDMETTQVGGNIDTFLPQMDFQNEPSMELKFDASSFLRSLNGKQNARLETTQIYSPNRAIGPSFASEFNVMEYDKENVIPMEVLPALSSDYQEPPASVDSKLFLQRLYGGATKEVEESKNGMEMDETACIDNTVRPLPSVSSHNNDVTKYFDTEDMTVGIEETKCIGGIVDESHHMDHDKENSVRFANQTVNMEETQPVGGILKTGNTAPQSGLRMQQGYNTSIIAEDNMTRCFNMEEDADNGIEETKCVGGIWNKVDKSNFDHLVTSKCVSDNLSTTRDFFGSKNSRTLTNLNTSVNVLSNIENDKNRKLSNDMTVNFNVTGLQDKMEETRTVGGFLDKTLDVTRNEQQEHEVKGFIYGKKDSVNNTVAMEETVPLGKILDSGHSRSNIDQSLVKMSLSPAEQPIRSVNTNKSKQVQGIWRESTDDNLNITGSQREEMEITKNLTVPMEITKPVGGFLDKGRSAGGEIGPDNSLNFSVMEETKALGGILDSDVAVNKRADIDKFDKTIDYTVEMEETKATGRIHEKTNPEVNGLGEKSTGNIKDADEPLPVEKVQTVGGDLNKTLERTVFFDDVNTNWLSEDLKPESVGKAADGTTADGVNQTIGIEETNCLGGILTNDMEMIKKNAESIYNHANVSENNKTTMETVQMEETRCLTKETTYELKQKQVNENFNKQPELYRSSTENVLKAAQAESVLIVSSNENETGKTFVSNEVDSGDLIVDDEITLKFSNKRNFEECSRETQDKDQEKTREITQTGLAKLKEMLILSKRKTAPSLRQGDIRTPSKFSPLFPGSAPSSASKNSCSSKQNFGETRSPVHKRQRLSEGMQAVSELGIDEEQMPDTMHLDLCTSGSTSDTHSDKNSTVQSDPVSTTVQDDNETHSSGNDTRNSSGVNLSLFSNKSFAYSFVVPDGPLSLESFFKLTFTLASKIQGTRCSTIFAPSIDMDDMAEVLHAELTLTPMVQAKKKMKELFSQQIQKSEEGMEWLEKSLEETQPEIFQKCAKASSEELQEISGQLRSLLSACHKEGEIAWKEGTKQMFSEALHDIQEVGVRRAEEMLQMVQSDSQSLENILTSLNDELVSLDEKERKLEELQNKQDILSGEMEKLALSLQEKSVEESDLYSELQCLSKKQQADEVVASLKQEVVSHLICCEWNLLEMKEDVLEFSFLDDKLNLLISLSPGVQEKQISNIVWERQSPGKVPKYFEDRVALELALNGINTTILKQKFTTISTVPELIHEVSSSVNEIRRFCMDLEDVHLYHMLTFQNNSVYTELWDRETLDLITVSFRFDPAHPLTSHAEPCAVVKIGTLKSCDIEDALRAVKPGPGYLSRLIKAVNFRQLRNKVPQNNFN